MDNQKKQPDYSNFPKKPRQARVKALSDKIERLSLHTYGKEPECVYLAKQIKLIEDPYERGLILRQAGRIIGSGRRVLSNMALATVLHITVTVADDEAMEPIVSEFAINPTVHIAMDGYMELKRQSLVANNIPKRFSKMMLRALQAAKRSYLKKSAALVAEAATAPQALTSDFLNDSFTEVEAD